MEPNTIYNFNREYIIMAAQEPMPSLIDTLDDLRRCNGYVCLIGNIYMPQSWNGEQHFHLLDENILWKPDTQRLGVNDRPLRSARIRGFIGYNASAGTWYHTWERTMRGQVPPDIRTEQASMDDVELFRDHILTSRQQDSPGIYDPRTTMLLEAAASFLSHPEI